MLEPDDLLAALIIEDQNAIPSALADLGMMGHFTMGHFMVSPEHSPFLSPDTATRILENTQHALPAGSQPVPQSTDMPLSPQLGEILAAASDLRNELRSKEVTPLHLFVVMMRGSHSGVPALRGAGITEEEVLTAIREEDQG